MDDAPFEILILGDTSTVEMRAMVETVVGAFAGWSIQLQPDCSSIPEAADERDPALVVVCQSWPDEFSRADVLRLLARFPLARWVCCFGLWCESDGRNRDVWPLGVRVPARNALGRLLHERDVLRQRAPALPLTAGRDEAFEFDGWSSARWSSSFSLSVVRPTAGDRTTGSLKAELQPAAAVHSLDRELRRCFEDRLRELGIVIDTPAADSQLDCLLFDADPWNAEAAETLRRLRHRHPGAAIIALMNFARPDDVRALTRCGADAVVPKLIDASALAAVLEETSAVHLPVEQIPDADHKLHKERHEKMHGRREHQHD